MFTNGSVFSSSNTLRAAAGLRLVLIMTFAGPARADDVVFGFAAGMGGTNWDQGNAIAVDGSGNVYTTGRFSGTADFDPGAGTANITGAGGSDIFVSKLTRTGYLVEAWVDFGFGGTEYGSVDMPFDTLA